MPNIDLTAILNSQGQVEIQGAGGARLPRGSGAHMFNFQLADNTGLGVTFRTPEEGLLTAEDNANSCPPSSNSSSQIDRVARPNPMFAQFRDKNDNEPEDMPVSYLLRFNCAGDPNQSPTFDPIIINGGK